VIFGTSRKHKVKGEIEREQISTTTQGFNITNLRVNSILYFTINKLNPFSHPKRIGEYSNFNQNKIRIYIYIAEMKELRTNTASPKRVVCSIVFFLNLYSVAIPCDPVICLLFRLTAQKKKKTYPVESISFT
jgi:hypothetical protein